MYGAPGTMTQSAVASGALTLRARRFTTRCSLLRSESNDYALSTRAEPMQKSPTQRVTLLYGAPGTIRTYDRLIRSQVLYPAELRARRGVSYSRAFLFQVYLILQRR